MLGRGSPPDETPDGTAAISSGAPSGVHDVSAGTRAWALGDEQARAYPPFESIVRAANDELLRPARAYALRRVGPDDVEDAINTVWEKVLTRFDKNLGTFEAFFFTVLRTTCYDILRNRGRMSLLSGDAASTGEPEHGDPFPDLADEVIDRIDDLQDRIIAAIEVLDLTEKERGMLRMMLGSEEAGVPDDPADGPADPKAAAAARQQKKRLRAAVDRVAGLTPDELTAASLLRRHHTVAAATAAAPHLDVRGLRASAKRKVFALFDIETETED